MSTDQSPKYLSYRHPGNAFTFDYPAHWKFLLDEEKTTTTVFSEEHPDVLMEFFIFPYCIDTQLFGDRLLQMLTEILKMGEAREIAESNLLQYPSMSGLAGKISKIWVTAHDDLTMGITVTCDPSKEHNYQHIFERALTSFRIHRGQQVERQRLCLNVAGKLNEIFPDMNFKAGANKISADSMELGVDNLAAQIQQQPSLSEQLIDDYVASVAAVIRTQAVMGQETWDQVRENILPMIRPDSITQTLLERAKADQNEANEKIRAQQELISAPWLADLVVCYAIDQPTSFRMIIQADLERWGLDADRLHEQAMQNLKQSELPEFSLVLDDDGKAMFGGLGEGGRSAKSSYLLHPELYGTARHALGNDIWVTIPNRDSLMMFSMNAIKRNALAGAVNQDFQSSNHPISDRIFLLTQDGVALG